MDSCGCYINHRDGDVEEIVQCSLHLEAPYMLEALKATDTFFKEFGKTFYGLKDDAPLQGELAIKVRTTLVNAETRR